MRRKILILILILIVQIQFLPAQLQGDFSIKAPSTLCQKGDFIELKPTEDFSCKEELNSAAWYFLENGVYQYFSIGKTVFVNPSLLFFGNNAIREIELKVYVNCAINNTPTVIQRTQKIILVDNDYFNLKINSSINCETTNILLSLLDLDGILGSGSLEDIEWTVPSGWTITSGQGTANINIQTNGNIKLNNDHFNYVSGGSIVISSTFEFEALSTSSLNLFIEECSCSSQWHDPNLLGDIEVNFPDADIFFKYNDHAVFSSKSFLDFDNKQKSVVVYPNPKNNILYINGLSATETNTIHVNIFNSQGSVVRSQYLDFISEGLVTVNLIDFPNGIYLIQFYNSENLFYEKVVKN